MNIEKGDFVTRKSHNNDIIFKVISISEDTVYLKGVYDRLYADSDIFDLVKTDEKPDDFFIELDINNDRTSYFYLPGKILHIDGDNEYLVEDSVISKVKIYDDSDFDYKKEKCFAI